MTANPGRTVLAFDFGEKRIGISIGQTVSRTAQALATVVAKQGRADWARIADLIDEWRPDSFVVGMPTTADGAPHPMAPAIKRFARQLNGRFKRPVDFVDERLSSYIAEERARGSRHDIDALAAQAILETWLDDAARQTTIVTA